MRSGRLQCLVFPGMARGYITGSGDCRGGEAFVVVLALSLNSCWQPAIRYEREEESGNLTPSSLYAGVRWS